MSAPAGMPAAVDWFHSTTTAFSVQLRPAGGGLLLAGGRRSAGGEDRRGLVGKPVPSGSAGERFRRGAERTQFAGPGVDSMGVVWRLEPLLRAPPAAPGGILRAARRPPGAGVP